MIIPTELLDKWRISSLSRDLDKLACLLELRDIIAEIKTQGDSTVEQAYKEAAEALRYSASHLRHLVGDLREYPEGKLIEWITNGVTFAAIRTINTLGSFNMLNTQPATLFDEAINPGNAEGKTMTTDELYQHATSHNPHATAEYKFNQWIYRGVANFAIARQDEFIAELKQLVERYKQ